MPDMENGQGLPAQPPEKPSAKYPTRELGRLLSFYKKNVRDYLPQESVGVIRNIQRLIDKGIEYQDIVQALKNYADDEWRKNSDPKYTMGVRTFFTEVKVKEWINPIKRKAAVPEKPKLPQIDFEPMERPKPFVPQAQTLFVEEEESEL